MKNFIHEHIDFLQILGVGGTGFSGMLLDVELWLKIAIALATLGYIGRKWYLMEKKK